VTLLELLEHVSRIHDDRFINKTSLKGIYQDVQIHGLNYTAWCSVQSEKENCIQNAFKYSEQ